MYKKIKRLVVFFILITLFTVTIPSKGYSNIKASPKDELVTLANQEYKYINEKYYSGIRYSGSYYAPWCCYFVTYCAKKAGISKSIIPNNIGNCDTLYNTLINNCGAKVVKKPQKGDLVFYKVAGNDFLHVGIMTSSTMSIQGNYSHTVKKMKATDYICGRPYTIVYVRPAYIDIPKNLKVTKDTSVSKGVKVSWDNVSGAYAYKVTVKSPSTSEISYYTKNNYIVKSIKNIYEEYSYSVTAYKYNGTKKVYGSKSDTFKYIRDKLESPKTVSIESDESSSQSVKITWSPVKGASGYHVTIKSKISGDEKITFNTTSTSALKKIKYNYAEYKYIVKAYKTYNTKKYYGNYKSEYFAKKVLPKPENLQISGDESYENGVKISWNSVKDASGYFVVIKSSTIPEDIISFYTTKTSAVKELYYQYTNYTYSVQAYKSLGELKCLGDKSVLVR